MNRIMDSRRTSDAQPNKIARTMSVLGDGLSIVCFIRSSMPKLKQSRKLSDRTSEAWLVITGLKAKRHTTAVRSGHRFIQRQSQRPESSIRVVGTTFNKAQCGSSSATKGISNTGNPGG